MKHLSGKALCRVLERHGWNLARVKGAHHIYRKPGAQRPVPVPVHGSTVLKAGTQRAIMKEAGLREEDLR
jgi:predicted RNA binding protein YcfA (HicA-like mRNA interferase family)